MDLNQIANQLELLRDSGKRVPGFGSKVMVEGDKLALIANQLKEALPSFVDEAQAIITQKDSILEQAHLEAERVKQGAEKAATDMSSAATLEHKEMVGESEVLKEARTQAEDMRAKAGVEAQSIVQDAQRKAYSITSEAEASSVSQREGADRYSLEVLSQLEEKLAETLGQVRRGIDSIRSDSDVSVIGR